MASSYNDHVLDPSADQSPWRAASFGKFLETRRKKTSTSRVSYEKNGHVLRNDFVGGSLLKLIWSWHIFVFKVLIIVQQKHVDVHVS